MKFSSNSYVIGENIYRMLTAMDHHLPNGRISGTRHNQQWLMTQFELMGAYVSKNTVSDWCLGKKTPSLENAIILTRILHCSLDDLVRDWLPEDDLSLVA